MADFAPNVSLKVYENSHRCSAWKIFAACWAWYESRSLQKGSIACANTSSKPSKRMPAAAGANAPEPICASTSTTLSLTVQYSIRDTPAWAHSAKL